MAGIINETARQFNLKTIKDGKRTVVRLAPGFNVVDDEHWKAFVDGRKTDPYVASLKKQGLIKYGKEQDDLELEMDPDTKSKSKSEPISKLYKKQVADAEKRAEESEDKAATEKAQREKAEAEAEKAKLELAELKKSIEAKSK